MSNVFLKRKVGCRQSERTKNPFYFTFFWYYDPREKKQDDFFCWTNTPIARRFWSTLYVMAYLNFIVIHSAHTYNNGMKLLPLELIRDANIKTSYVLIFIYSLSLFQCHLAAVWCEWKLYIHVTRSKRERGRLRVTQKHTWFLFPAYSTNQERFIIFQKYIWTSFTYNEIHEYALKCHHWLYHVYFTLCVEKIVQFSTISSHAH